MTIQSTICTLILMIGLIVAPFGPLLDSITAKQNGDVQNAEPEIKAGLQNVGKLGHWLQINAPVPMGTGDKIQQLKITTVDGDAMPFSVYVDLPPNESKAIGWVKPGRINAPIEVRLLDSNGVAIGDGRTIRNSKGIELLPAVSQFLVGIGADLDYQKSIRATGRDSEQVELRIEHIQDLTDLPETALGWDSVDTLVITTSDRNVVEQLMNGESGMAIVDWVRSGGQLVLSAGKNGETVFGVAHPFRDLAPGSFSRIETIDSSNSLEWFARPAQQLFTRKNDRLSVTVFEDVDGQVEVEQSGIPLIIRRPHGLGQVLIVAFDLDDPLIQSWNGQTKLIGSLLQTVGFDSDTKETISSGSLTTHLGYTDISGQLRMSLEQFQKVTFVTFTLIALLIGIYILFIGLGDYFFLKKLVGRMEMTWLSFSFLTLLFCGAAVLIVGATKTNEIQINQVEIVDIDQQLRSVRGRVWTHVFSPRTEFFDMELESTNELGIPIESSLLSSLGLPGTGIGGMQSTAGNSLFDSEYSVKIDRNRQRHQAKIDSATIQIGSTKSVSADWVGVMDEYPVSELRLNERIDRITGTIRNPFDVDLQNCFLLYKKKAYRFDKLDKLGSVQVVDGSERSIQAFLQDQGNTEDTVRWNRDDADPSRLLRMMMFFQTAGGSNFTGLTNGHRSGLDLSEHLECNRAIFVAEIPRVTTPIRLNRGEVTNRYDKQLTMIRFVLPVQVSQSER